MQNLININNVELMFPQDEQGTIFVPIKPICEILEIANHTQQDAIKAHPILGPTILLRGIVAADGAQREMNCLPLKYAMAWILGIDARNVKPEAKENLLKYQNECYDAIYDKFFLEPQRQKDKLIMITKQEAFISDLKTQRADITEEIKNATQKLLDIKNTDTTQLSLLII